MEKLWKDIEGYEGYYKISSNGEVYSIKSQRLKKQFKASGGYCKVLLKVNQKQKAVSVHRLVAKAFIPNPYDLPEVNHKDEDKSNNNVNNLEWCTHFYNMHYGTGIARQKAAQHCKAVEYFDLTTNKTLGTFPSIHAACENLNISQGNLSKVCRGTRKSLKGYGWRYA